MSGRGGSDIRLVSEGRRGWLAARRIFVGGTVRNWNGRSGGRTGPESQAKEPQRGKREPGRLEPRHPGRDLVPVGDAAVMPLDDLHVFVLGNDDGDRLMQLLAEPVGGTVPCPDPLA